MREGAERGRGAGRGGGRQGGQRVEIQEGPAPELRCGALSPDWGATSLG